ncbi:(2Fe-2S)-binding protein [Lentzea sp. NPDC051213]|uniref:(2Fe-2S)-binding protein n=1 Tax=Lentzea sp. NPDC051213 TaxID=3364126 RepID=UPI0037AFF17E
MDRPESAGEVAQTAVKRRTFVAGAVTVAGAAVAADLINAEAVAAEGVADAGAGSRQIRLTINDEPRTITVDNRTSLLDLLRERLGMTGTKKGCNQGACGACTILLDGKRVNSCLTLAVMHEGASVTTIEGVADGERLHPLQQAFIDCDGYQCGYCTAGQIMSGLGCIAERHTGSAEEIREWMSGNICRCGAYTNIVSAIQQASNKG